MVMAKCERLEGCPFFKKFSYLPKVAEQLAVSYCQQDNSGCARLFLLSKKVRPPDDLFPDDREEALRILSLSAPIKMCPDHKT
jgi:hypothetical protein